MDTSQDKTDQNRLLASPRGEHSCLFYLTGQDLLEALVPFFRYGLENNEFCVWVTSPPLSVDQVKEALRAGVPDFDGYLNSGQMEIFPYTEWYMKGGHFDAERVLSGWVAKFEDAMAKGYSGMRVTGNTAWLDKSQWQDFADYEEAINGVMQERMTVLCTYSLEACGASEIMDVLENHQYALCKRDGVWQAFETSERKLAEQAIQEREEELRAIYENAPLIMMLVDSERRVRKVNRFAEEFADSSSAELLKKRAGEALGCINSLDDPKGCGFGPECQQCPVRTTIDKTFETGSGVNQVEASRPLEVGGERAEATFLLSTSRLNVRGEPEVLITIQDITERKRTEEKIRDAELRYRTLFEQSPDGVVIIDPSTMTPLDFNDKACQQLGYSRDEFAQLKVKDYDAQFSPSEINVENADIMIDGSASFETRHRRKDGEIREMQVSVQEVELHNQQVLYCIFRDITEKKAAEAKLQRTAQLNDALNRINLTIGSTLEFDEIMREVMMQANDALGSESAILATARESDTLMAGRADDVLTGRLGGMAAKRSKDYFFRYTQGSADATPVGSRLSVEVAPVAAAALEAGKTMAVSNTFEDDRFDNELLRKLNIYSSLATPLSVKSGIFGVIAFRYHTEPTDFSQPEIDFVEKLGASISMAMENARLFRRELDDRAKIQGFASRLSLLHDIGLTLNQESDKRRLLSTILKGAAELTFAGVGAMILVRDGRTDLVSMYYAPWYDGRCTITADASMLHQRVERLVALSNKDCARINTDALGESLKLPEGHPDLSGVLLIGTIRDTRGRPRGYFMLSHKAGGAQFSSEDEEIISLLVAQSSVALISAENFEREHEVAETLQTALLPAIPAREDMEIGLVYRSAASHSRLGGDFYDFIQLDGGRVAVAVGDVCGKGLEAASATAMVKYMLRAYIGTGLSAGECLTLLNRAVCKQIAMEKFVTLGLAILDPEKYSVDYSSAGHPAPVIFRAGFADSLKIQQAVPLGVIPEYDYKSTSAIATPDNYLLVYTDGLIDARPPDGAPFGESRVIETVSACNGQPAQRIAEDLIEAAVQYSDGHMRDDMALVILSFNAV